MSGITKLGKYLIRRELGKGAMGVVYEGFDPVIERTVAIKTILPQQLNSAEAGDVLARFKREAQAAGRLNHPGIVAVYDYGEVVAEDDLTMVAGPGTVSDARERVAFIAMEFVKGRELRDYFEANERFALPEVARLMGEILDALSHAHAKGVVHRDMKPANLIVLDSGKVKIADFGIARVEKSELTQAGTVMGTPSYMSPEQFMGQTVDGRSDLFSCGVILYQFLTGEKPFTGNTTTIMYKVLREEPLAPSMLNVALPSAWDAVVKKAMAKNPDQRFQTAAEFAASIQAAVANPGAEQTLINAGNSTLIDPGGTMPRTHAAPATPASTRTRSPKAMVGALAGLALVGGIGAAYMLIGKSTDKPAPLAQNQAVAPAVAATPAAAPPPVITPVVVSDPAQDSGNVIISALGLVDPKDARFKGDPGAAQAEARADAKRQLIEKVLGLYIDSNSLNKNYALIEQKLLSRSGSFIKSVLHEGAPSTGKDGLLETETRAVVKVRDVQKSLNQLSKDERIDFIRNNGDPRVSIQMNVANAESAQALPPARSQLAENVLKERIKSFGFRVWSNEGEARTGPDAKVADFVIQGEARLKQLSAKLPTSGLTITKTVLTSWTVKAIDKASGEEIYLNTVMPKGQSWATEDQALGDIGKQMGDEFSKNFFLQHFNFGVRQTQLHVTGLPDAQTAQLLLRELRGIRQVLDVQLLSETGKFQLQLAEGSASDVIQDAVIRPLNSKLGQNCFALAGSSDTQINMSFASTCADVAVRGKLETAPPAGLMGGSISRGKSLLKGSPMKPMT
ncbi:serine/threonine-protein kinase [Rhodoferax sp.]|uniref:serine/threonine protein kinase n=1 Tax=Rhodoferax sp. TaxID=50421 RepID=UPI001EC6197E|nr:serine/threonine-protein kinase [Rhodoferax sp.]MBT9506166.1 serine/threonine protein kinase [Rhodoferax sp.]